MKARVRRYAAAAAALAIVGIGAVLGRALWRQTAAPDTVLPIDLIPDVAQRIQDFHRVQVRDGKKLWEIAASEARYFDEKEMVVVRDPMVRLFLRDGRSVGVKGNEGTVHLRGKELRSVDLSGAIEVTLADYTVRTEQAHYDRASDVISAAGEVLISGEELDAQGGGLRVEVGAQRLHLLGDVRMTLHPQREGRDGA